METAGAGVGLILLYRGTALAVEVVRRGLFCAFASIRAMAATAFGIGVSDKFECLLTGTAL